MNPKEQRTFWVALRRHVWSYNRNAEEEGLFLLATLSLEGIILVSDFSKGKPVPVKRYRAELNPPGSELAVTLFELPLH